MTCQDALTLLEEYVDKELPTEKEALVKQHFNSCPRCREELDTALLLKELLEAQKSPDPGETYFQETTRIIKARTVETSDDNYAVTSLVDLRVSQRNALLRSVVSVAASLVILFSALLIGSGQQERLAQIEASRPPVLYAASIEDMVGGDNAVYVTRDENTRMARGMMLLGAPGFLGRLSSPISASALTN